MIVFLESGTMQCKMFTKNVQIISYINLLNYYDPSIVYAWNIHQNKIKNVLFGICIGTSQRVSGKS